MRQSLQPIVLDAEADLDSHVFLLLLTVAAALLAVWVHCRFPGAGPQTLTGGVLGIVVTGILLQLTLPLSTFLISKPSLAAAVAGVIGVMLPALALAFLSTIWLLRVAAGALGGTVR